MASRNYVDCAEQLRANLRLIHGKDIDVIICQVAHNQFQAIAGSSHMRAAKWTKLLHSMPNTNPDGALLDLLYLSNEKVAECFLDKGYALPFSGEMEEILELGGGNMKDIDSITKRENTDSVAIDIVEEAIIENEPSVDVVDDPVIEQEPAVEDDLWGSSFKTSKKNKKKKKSGFTFDDAFEQAPLESELIAEPIPELEPVVENDLWDLAPKAPKRDKKKKKSTFTFDDEVEQPSLESELVAEPLPEPEPVVDNGEWDIPPMTSKKDKKKKKSASLWDDAVEQPPVESEYVVEPIPESLLEPAPIQEDFGWGSGSSPSLKTKKKKTEKADTFHFDEITEEQALEPEVSIPDPEPEPVQEDLDWGFSESTSKEKTKKKKAKKLNFFDFDEVLEEPAMEPEVPISQPTRIVEEDNWIYQVKEKDGTSFSSFEDVPKPDIDSELQTSEPEVVQEVDQWASFSSTKKSKKKKSRRVVEDLDVEHVEVVLSQSVTPERSETIKENEGIAVEDITIAENGTIFVETTDSMPVIETPLSPVINLASEHDPQDDWAFWVPQVKKEKKKKNTANGTTHSEVPASPPEETEHHIHEDRHCDLAEFREENNSSPTVVQSSGQTVICTIRKSTESALQRLLLTTFNVLLTPSNNTLEALYLAANDCINKRNGTENIQNLLQIKSGRGRNGVEVDLSAVNDVAWPMFLEHLSQFTNLPELTIDILE